MGTTGLDIDLGSPALTLRNVDDVVRIVDATTNHADPKAQRKAHRMTMLVMVIALGGVFVDAYDFTSLGIGAIQLRHEFHLTATQVGALSSTMAFSALFGALVGGYFVDKLGRKRMFLLDLWFFVFSAIGAALAPNLVVLLAFRLLMGLGVGLDFPVAMSFVAEFADRANRGRFVNLSYLNWYLAAIVGFIASWIGYIFGAGEHLWRLAVGFGAVPALILLLMRNRYMLESPLWAAHQGDLEEAARILRRTRNIKVEVAPDAVAAQERAALTAGETARIIFSPQYRPRAILAAVISCLQSIEYYAVIFYLPVISQLIFGGGLPNAIRGGIIFSFIGLVGSAFQALVCDRTGIRPLTIAGATITVVALLGVALGHATDSTALEAFMVGLFMIGHTIGPGPQGMAYGTLSFPTAIRGSAVGWTQGMLRVGSITGFFFFPVMLTAFGFTATFALLAGAPAIIALVTLAIRWEPIGVDIENEPIEIDLRHGAPGVPLATAVGAAPMTPPPTVVDLPEVLSNGHASATVTFMATVRAGSEVPQGTVTFSQGTTVLGTVPLDQAGQARFSTGLGVGKDIVTAVYNGDGATGVSAAAVSARSPTATTTELTYSAEVTRLETTLDLTEPSPEPAPI